LLEGELDILGGCTLVAKHERVVHLAHQRFGDTIAWPYHRQRAAFVDVVSGPAL